MGINLNDIKERSAISLLSEYKGINPYLIKLQKEYKDKGKIILTENQSKYIIDNHNKEPLKVNRVLEITDFLAKELQEKENLSFLPKKILIQYILGETEKTFHIYGKLKKNQEKSRMYWIPKTQLLDDPYFEPINVDVDFEKYTELDTLHRSFYEHQKQGVKFLLSRNGCILGDTMGLGKCEHVDNKVFTPFGRKRIGDIVVGDFVIGSDGKPTLVNGVFPQKSKKLYRVTFNDGYSILVSDDHLFTVSNTDGGKNTKGTQNKSVTLSVKQMLDKNLKIRFDADGKDNGKSFKTYYKLDNGNNKWQIPIVKPIEFSRNQLESFCKGELPIDPYLLGVLLGDGHINKHGDIKIELHKDDFNEIFHGQIINEGKINQNKRVNNIYTLKEEIKLLNLNGRLSHTKFIPDIYKYSSIKDRLSILQGLMDTDGYCMKSKNGKFAATEYCTVSEQLADDVAEIVHSLGGIVRKHSKIGSYRKEDGTKVICKKVYRLNIKLPTDMNPFRLKRKADLYNAPQKYKVGRYIKNIEFEKEDKAICIQVAAKDHLYVTEHGIVTHNTLTSIIAALESGAERILIVCPASLKINWEREINYFSDHTSIISGNKWKPNKFTIINYDILKNFHSLNKKKGKKKNPEDIVIEYNREIVNHKFDLVIIDEAHFLKNPKSIRTKIMNEICLTIEKVWLLSGTPIANRPMDFYNLLKLIKAPIADNWVFFAKRYCDGKKFFKTLANGRKKQIWLTDGASNLDELALKTKNVLLRRLKDEILDMPEKTIVPILHELDKKGWEEYDSLWDAFIQAKIEKGENICLQKDLVELILLRKFIAMEAIPYTIEMAENAIEQGEKVVIFTNFTDELMELYEYFGNSAVIHYGQMNDKDKQNSIDLFMNNPKINVFIGNIKSAGVGITLTSSNIVIFNSFDWVPGNNEQAEDRSHRISQKNNVTIYYQLFKNTISFRMWLTLREKKDIINQILLQEEKLSEEEKEILKQMENFKNEKD